MTYEEAMTVKIGDFIYLPSPIKFKKGKEATIKAKVKGINISEKEVSFDFFSHPHYVRHKEAFLTELDANINVFKTLVKDLEERKQKIAAEGAALQPLINYLEKNGVKI